MLRVAGAGVASMHIMAQQAQAASPPLLSSKNWVGLGRPTVKIINFVHTIA